jgi:para-nitrobenzyl esterase
VLVNINYRLGRLGFFAHPALTREAHGEPLANYGLMDQIAALKWVRDNIAGFGGDPRHVTIAGGSAGGASVLALMTSPQARGLFQQAIVQSGLGREHTLDLRGAEQLGVALSRRWGVSRQDAKALRATPVQTILAQEQDPNEPFLRGQFPVVDGRILPAPVLESFEAAREAPVPLVIGSMTLELPVAVQPAVLKARVAPHAQLPADLRAVYPDPTRYAGLLPSDVVFTEPSAKLAALHAGRAPTFVYRFGITADAVEAQFGGAVHGTEGPYVFGTYDASPFPIGPRQRAQGRTVHAYWASFVRSGDPNGDDRPVWPRFAGSQVMSFTNQGPKPGPDPAAARLEAVGAALDQGRLDVLARP